MKSTVSVFLVLGLSTFLSAVEPMKFNIQFPELQTAMLDSGEVSLSMDGLPNTVSAGLPRVPMKTIKIAVPEGFLYRSVSWAGVGSARASLPGAVSLASSQIPISWMGNIPKDLPQTMAPSFRGKFYPEKQYDVSVQTLHGVQVLIVNLYPVRVSLQSSSIYFVKGGSLQIQLDKGNRVSRRLFTHELEAVRAFVDNKEDILSFEKQGVRSLADYDYLIISTENFISYTGTNGFSELQASLLARGLRSQVVDMATIAASETGADLIDKIRAFIKGQYTTHGIRYVLLAGEGRESQPNFIPTRKLCSKINAYFGAGTGWVPLEVEIPADTYYGCLDGVFNGNGNAHWGEPEDGEKGGDVDFLAEVTVGRVVLRSTTDLQNFVKKTVQVGANGIAKNVMLMGELLFAEKDLYGDEYMDQLIGSVDEHGFITNGFGPEWKDTKLYDRKNQWTGTAAQSQMNKYEFGMVNHLGHSNNTMNMRLTTSNISSFTNVNPFFYYTQGCYAAGFNTNSFVDRLVAATHAAVAAVGNTSYGLAPEDPQPKLTKTPGASQMLHRAFTHSLLAGPNVALGRAHVASKEFHIGLKSAQEIRWVNWTANFFGDPSLTLGK